ncbi:ABC-2 type transport system permease protein [Peribacillus deserti]|uniref:ABC-2 type transport system permease protein n=1 Tax=Peribacillus deserti TaxID=673318 RepID=A0ABS2QMV3_9BACI|nr:ABC transporter permease [Peribacillus deserti]MBM7694039.1 ABC-2 type transport system permease protein [Peribacillus deserti]
MNKNALWQDRFKGFTKETGKYLKYIFNGHLVFVMIFAVGGLSFYYSEWVKTLSPDFPAAIIMAVILGLAVTSSPVMTFLKEADVVFLLPLETRLTQYFSKCIRVSFILQSYFLLMILAAFMPIHAKVNGASLADFLTAFILLAVLKYLNVQIRWRILRYDVREVLFIDSLIRLCLNIACLYLFFRGASIFFAVMIAGILILLLFYFERETRKKSLKWERLISLEGKRMSAFYRVANLFTDVPKLKEKVSRRKWLDWIVSYIKFKNSSSYIYLYARTFLRSNDYLGLSVRLTIIGAALSIVFVSIWAKAITVLFILYLTGIQILPIARHHDLKIWLDLYPLTEDMKKRAVAAIINRVLLLQNMILCLVILTAGNIIDAVFCFAGGILFLLVFSGYARKKMTGLR